MWQLKIIHIYYLTASKSQNLTEMCLLFMVSPGYSQGVIYGAFLGKNLPKLTQIWGRINVLAVVGLRVPASCQLLPGGYPHFQMATLKNGSWASPPWPLTFLSKQAEALERECQPLAVSYTVTELWNCRLIPCHSPVVRSRPQALPTRGGRGASRRVSPKRQESWQGRRPLQSLPQTANC